MPIQYCSLEIHVSLITMYSEVMQTFLWLSSLRINKLHDRDKLGPRPLFVDHLCEDTQFEF